MEAVGGLKDKSVGFIGAGRVGYALSCLLEQKDVDIAFIVDVDSDKAKFCGESCGARIVGNSLHRIEANANIIIIAVPDDEIGSVAVELAQSQFVSEGTVVAHTSGLYASHALEALRERGAVIASLHPATSFPEAFNGKLDNVTFAIEGDVEACRALEQIVLLLGGEIVRIRPEEKSRYHLGCTLASNYLVAIAGTVNTLFKDIENIESFATLHPLIDATLRNIASCGPVNALTGPIARGDVKTIETHLELLNNTDVMGMRAYITLGRMSLKLASDRGLEKEKKQAIEVLFQRFEGVDT